MNPIIRFLASLRSLANSGVIKSIDQAMDFAKREFGEVNDLLKRQIEQVFKQPKAPRPGEGGITSIKNPPKKEIPSQAPGTSPVMQRLEKGIETLKEMKQPGMDLATGLTRTAARKILDRAGIKVADKADPIDIFEKEFGGDALMDVKDVAEEMIEIERMGKATKSIDEILEQSGLFNIKRNPNARKGMSDAELQKIITEEDVKSKSDEDYLNKIIDPEEPEEFNTGGRVGLKSGSYLYKAYKGSALEKLMNNPRVEGTVLGYEGIGSLIDILRGFGLFSKGGRVGYAYGSASKFIMGIINSIKKLKPIDAMKEMNEVVAKRGKYKNLNDDEVKKIFDDTNDHIFERDVPADEFAVKIDDEVKKNLKDVDEAYGVSPEMKKELDEMSKLTPKAAERFELRQKYPGIDENLLTRIIDDTDPTRKAKVLAELDQAMELMKRDISSEEVIDILKNQSRTKQAEGGLSYLMGF